VSPYRTPAEMPVVKPYKHSLWRRFCRVLRRVYIVWLTIEIWPFVNNYTERRRERRYWWEEGHPHMLRLHPVNENREIYSRVIAQRKLLEKRGRLYHYEPGASVTRRGAFDYSSHSRRVETKLVEVVHSTAGTILDIQSAVIQQNKGRGPHDR